jgi:sporulation protein YunB
MKSKIKLKSKCNIVNQNIIIFTIIIILITSYYICYIFSLKSKNVVSKYVESDLKQLSNYYINNIINIVINNDNSVKEITNIIKNNNGEIIGVDYDTLLLNNFLNKINERLYLDFNDISYNNLLKSSKNNIYYIPFGVFNNLMIFEELGPKIPIKIYLTKNISSNIKTNIENYGINNVLIKVYIEVVLNQRVILPFISKNIKTTQEVLLSMKIINGNIPKAYGGLYTYSSDINKLN